MLYRGYFRAKDVASAISRASAIAVRNIGRASGLIAYRKTNQVAAAAAAAAAAAMAVGGGRVI